jgi:hypothetical protein
VSTSTKLFTAVAVILLGASAFMLFRRSVVLDVPIALHTGATISHTFTVDRATSYYLEIACERTHEAAEAGNDLDDTLRDGLEADARITSNEHSIGGVDCSDPDHTIAGAGFYSRVLCTFDARPGKTYNLALHIIRYGQGLSSRDHKLAGTWDENLTIPAEAHPRLKIEVDPHDYQTQGAWNLLFLIGLICLIPLLRFCLLRLFRRASQDI